jgi:hypothetical protein
MIGFEYVFIIGDSCKGEIMPGHNKAVASGVAGAITTIMVWAASQFAGVTVPGEVASAVTAVIGTAIVWFVKSGVHQQP